MLIPQTKVLTVKSALYEYQVRSDSNLEFTDIFGAAAWIMSWATNVWATSLVGYKAWYVSYIFGFGVGVGFVFLRQSKDY